MLKSKGKKNKQSKCDNVQMFSLTNGLLTYVLMLMYLCIHT